MHHICLNHCSLCTYILITCSLGTWYLIVLTIVLLVLNHCSLGDWYLITVLLVHGTYINNLVLFPIVFHYPLTYLLFVFPVFFLDYNHLTLVLLNQLHEWSLHVNPDKSYSF